MYPCSYRVSGEVAGCGVAAGCGNGSGAEEVVACFGGAVSSEAEGLAYRGAGGKVSVVGRGLVTGVVLYLVAV